MHRIELDRTGGPEVLQLVERETPEPGPREVRVDIAAAGVNYIDTYHRSGNYKVSLPFAPGIEGAGTVSAVGSDVDTVAVGDHVAWANGPGSYAEQALVPAHELVPVPAGVTDEFAAAAMLQGLTAQYLTTSTYPVQPGDVALVHAAAGGVGQLLTQIVKIRGGRVIATVGTPEKAEIARALGADEVIDYRKADFAEETLRLLDGRGVDVVYDGVGKDTYAAGLTVLRRRGMLVLYGASSGPVPPVDLQELNKNGSLFTTRPTLAHYIATREELTARTAELFGWIADGRLSVSVGARYPLAEAARAHEDLQGRRTTGKLLLVP